MKKKALAMTMVLALGVSGLLAGCGSQSNSYANQTVYGEVTETADASITITVTSVEDASGNAESADSDESLVVAITDDTEITQAAGGMGMNGGGSDMGEAPSAMGGSASGDMGSAPENMGSDQGGSNSDSNSDSDVPEKPDSDSDSDSSDTSNSEGEAPDSGSDMGEAPSDMGGSASGDMGSATGDGSDEENSESLTVADISVGDTVAVTYDEDGNVTSIEIQSESGGQMGGSSSSSSDITYTAYVEYTEDTEVDGETITSTGTDENAILVQSDAEVSLSNMVLARESDDSTGGDNSSFYGVGATVLATDGTIYLTDSEITSDAAGGAGVFAYGDGVVYVSDTTITTQQDTSGGIHVAGGGTLYAWDLTVETNGQSSAAIRSDRGSGTMVVDGGTYTSNGTGSPAIYSTADITVNEATLTATGSEAICIEGLNSIRLYDCDLTGNMADDEEQNDITWNVILYQSQSGDSEDGNSTFEMVGGSLTAENGGMFYTTNTESTITLENVDITYAEDSEFFLQCTGNTNERGWGSVGSNGADCLFTAINQEMEGSVIWDSVSTLDFYMTEGSTLTGDIVDDETYAGDGGDGTCSVYIDESSTWVVTGDSELTNLYSEGTIVDSDGNTVSIVGTDGTVYVKGDSDYTITVENYSDSVDLSGASTTSSFSDYEVEKPSQLS